MGQPGCPFLFCRDENIKLKVVDNNLSNRDFAAKSAPQLAPDVLRVNHPIVTEVWTWEGTVEQDDPQTGILRATDYCVSSAGWSDSA